jgi:isoleucyl-tRNA synthetase
MSNWYVRRCRERFWAKGMEQDKINAYMTLYTALVELSKAAAPMIPFMTEEIYQNLVCSVDKSAKESIHLCDFPKVNESMIDKKLEENMEAVLKIVTIGRAARNSANIKNRQPIGEMIVKTPVVPDEFYTAIIREELNVKSVSFADDVSGFTSYTFKPQLKTVGPKYGKFLKGVQQHLAGLDGNTAMAELKDKGAITFDVDGTEISLAQEDLLISMSQKDGYAAEADGAVTVVMNTNLSEELIEEGFVYEVISKLQTMRKDSGFEVMDRIEAAFTGNDKLQDVIKKNSDMISGKVLANEFRFGETFDNAKEWDINGEKLTISVKKV